MKRGASPAIADARARLKALMQAEYTAQSARHDFDGIGWYYDRKRREADFWRAELPKMSADDAKYITEHDLEMALYVGD